MKDYKKYFKGKKITVMGLGLLGRGLKVTKFLAENGAELIVTDLKKASELKTSLDELKKYKKIKYVLGKHRLQDFEGRDMIIKSPGVPLGSRYIARARNKKIPVEMDASLFAKLAPSVMLIGITGTRGKSTVTHMMHHVLEYDRKKKKRRKPRNFIGGNVRGGATLPLLNEAKEGDRIILELDSWQLQGFGTSEISPDLAVFTNFMQDHQNYYASMEEYFNDKANIFKYQVDGNYLVVGQSAFDAINKHWKDHIESTVALARANRIPSDWKLKVVGEHNRANAALVLQMAEIMKIEPDVIRAAMESFKGVAGRLEYIKTKNDRAIYNDNNATTPDATIAAIESFPEGKVVLITGGTDKALDYSKLGSVINKKVKHLVLLSGSGTNKLRSCLRIPSSEHDNLEEAVTAAWEESEPGDTILFSPASSSFEMFNNEYERNDTFVESIKKL